MVFVEKSVTELQEEIKALSQFQHSPASDMYILGATIAIKWMLHGGTKPSQNILCMDDPLP